MDIPDKTTGCETHSRPNDFQLYITLRCDVLRWFSAIISLLAFDFIFTYIVILAQSSFSFWLVSRYCPDGGVSALV